MIKFLLCICLALTCWAEDPVSQCTVTFHGCKDDAEKRAFARGMKKVYGR